MIFTLLKILAIRVPVVVVLDPIGFFGGEVQFQVILLAAYLGAFLLPASVTFLGG